MEKYKVYSNLDYEDLNKLNLTIENSVYRQYFHVQPLTGLLNDPNGFSYFDNKFHLFYQWYPFDAIHGMKHWYLTTSEDLIKFENKGIALLPNENFENYGAYSGSALEIEGQLNVFYTANHRDKSIIRRPLQVQAKLIDGKIQDKKIIIEPHYNYSEHQRDPSIYKYGKDYYILLGAQKIDGYGTCVVYKLDRENQTWIYKGDIKVKDYERFGYMWECPQLVSFDDKDVLFLSPQGVKSDSINNDNSCGYIVGKLNFETLEFQRYSEYTQLDNGFEFYASQVVKKDNQNYLIAWLGLPDLTLPTDSERWSSCLTLARKIELKDNRVYQNPLNFEDYLIDTNEIVTNNLVIENIEPMQINIEKSSNFRLRIYSNKSSEYCGFIIYYANGKLHINRSYLQNKIKGNQKSEIAVDLKNLRIFIDKSSIEIFLNDGEYSVTSRVFPLEFENELFFSSDFDTKISYSNIKKINQDFVL